MTNLHKYVTLIIAHKFTNGYSPTPPPPPPRFVQIRFSVTKVFTDAEAGNFKNVKSVHCRKNVISESVTIFSSPIIDKFQNVLRYKM